MATIKLVSSEENLKDYLLNESPMKLIALEDSILNEDNPYDDTSNDYDDTYAKHVAYVWEYYETYN